jgi:AcrR family transcriptional regulator
MKREGRSRDIKRMIIDVSRDLFIAKGYTVTTIRQITEKADINIGSLYHFFRDKEDILLHIVVDAYRDFMQESRSIIGKEMNPVLQYSVINALELKAVEKYDRIAELYLVVYNSWRITELMLSYNNQRNRLFFNKYNKTFNDQDYYIRTLALRGIRLGFIAERVKQGIVNFDIKCPFTIEMGLSLFNVPERTIKATINKTMRMINEKSIMIYGFNI